MLKTSAVASLHCRPALLDALLRIDAFALVSLPLPKELSWKRFLASHARIVRAEQMRWIALNAPPPLTHSQDPPVLAATQHAIVGLHAPEHCERVPFRGSHPELLFRVPAGYRITMVLATGNVRPGLDLSNLEVIVGNGKQTANIALTDEGDLKLSFETPPTPSGSTDVVLIAPEMVEAPSTGQPARRLGVPLFRLRVVCLAGATDGCRTVEITSPK